MSGDAPHATLSPTPAWRAALGDAAAKLWPRCGDGLKQSTKPAGRGRLLPFRSPYGGSHGTSEIHPPPPLPPTTKGCCTVRNAAGHADGSHGAETPRGGESVHHSGEAAPRAPAREREPWTPAQDTWHPSLARPLGCFSVFIQQANTFPKTWAVSPMGKSTLAQLV